MAELPMVSYEIAFLVAKFFPCAPLVSQDLVVVIKSKPEVATSMVSLHSSVEASTINLVDFYPESY